MSERYVLDTSALLAFMEREAGDTRVKSLLQNEDVLLPWPVLAELFYVTCREQGEETAEYRYALLKRSGARVVWEADEKVLLLTGRIKASHSLSFADALIAAYAARYDAVLVHKDPEYESLSGQVQLEMLPYK